MPVVVSVYSVIYTCQLTDATERFKDILGEIAGFISSTAHHFVVVAGDWNTDLRRPGEFSDAVCSFLRELNLSLIDLCFPDSVGFTYLGHDGSKSWLDHIAVSNCFCSSVVSVHSIRDGRNLSDHNPLAFSLDLSTPVYSLLNIYSRWSICEMAFGNFK